MIKYFVIIASLLVGLTAGIRTAAADCRQTCQNSEICPCTGCQGACETLCSQGFSCPPNSCCFAAFPLCCGSISKPRDKDEMPASFEPEAQDTSGGCQLTLDQASIQDGGVVPDVWRYVSDLPTPEELAELASISDGR